MQSWSSLAHLARRLHSQVLAMLEFLSFRCAKGVLWVGSRVQVLTEEEPDSGTLRASNGMLKHLNHKTMHDAHCLHDLHYPDASAPSLKTGQLQS